MEDHGDFETWPLHDAVLKSVRMDWVQKRCIVEIAVYLDEGRDAQPCLITFERVAEVVIPCRAPWGPSSFVNEQVRKNGAYALEMQSGDEILVVADAARLSRDEGAAEQ